MIEPLREIDDVINDAPSNRYGNAQSRRIEDILRPIHGKVNELTDAVNDLQAVVHEGPEDFMSDLDDEDDESACACDDDAARPWRETEPFVERLHHLSTSQLEHLLEEAEWILEGRHRQDQTGMCPECQAKEDEETDDGYCEQCNDYHDAPDDDDGHDGERSYFSEEYPLFKEVDTSDGLFADFTAYVARNPKLRFFQAIRNFSGYNFIFGSMSKDADDYSQLEDTFNLKMKGPKKGPQ